MPELKPETAGPADTPESAPIWWPDVEIVAEARAGVTANLAILADHSAAVRAALARTRA